MNLIALCLFSFTLSPGHDTSVKECRKFEEKLYFNSILKRADLPSQFIDSLKGCMNESPALHLSLGKFYYTKNDYRNAEKELNKIVSDNSASKEIQGEAFYYLSLSAYYSGQNDLCIERGKKSLELNYHPSWTYNAMGLASEDKKEYRVSMDYYAKAIEADASNNVAVNNTGVIYSQLEENVEALKWFVRADSMVKGVEGLYKSNINRTLVDLKRFKDAEMATRSSYKKFPANKNIIYDYAALLERENNYNGALVCARQLVSMGPKNARQWFNIAYIYDNAGEYDSAFYYYNVALKYDPDYVSVHQNLGIIYRKRGMFEKANEKYDKVLALEPSKSSVYLSKSLLYVWMHDFEKAYEWTATYYEKFPNAHGADLMMGYSLQLLGKYSEAIPYFEKALIDKPNDDRALNDLGRCYAELKQVDKAFQYFDLALKSNVENSYIYHNRAALYYDLEKYDLACADLKTAIDKEYNWIIDEKLEKMKQAQCPQVNTNRKVLIYEYKGNVKELSRFSFIELSDSSLDQSIAKKITLDETTVKVDNEEKITSTSFDSFKVFPNPASGKFYIERPEDIRENLTVKILNENGTIVLDNTWGDTRILELELKHAKPGIYVVMLLNNNSVLTAKKLVVQ